MTSKNSPLQNLLPMELPLTRSAEGSRAKTSQTLASRLALRVSEAVSGLNTPASLANYDPASCSWRTSQRCLIEGWTVFSATWPRSGMMRGGIAYQLAPLALLTEETDCGSLPTPRSTDGHKGQRTLAGAQKELARGKNMDLGMVVRLWPTPSARDWKDNPGAWMWNATNPDGTHRNRTDQLPRKVYAVEGTAQNGVKLNPTLVEWLMGFPRGHTYL